MNEEVISEAASEKKKRLRLKSGQYQLPRHVPVETESNRGWG
jgi:hypothetical protein